MFVGGPIYCTDIARYINHHSVTGADVHRTLADAQCPIFSGWRVELDDLREIFGEGVFRSEPASGGYETAV